MELTTYLEQTAEEVDLSLHRFFGMAGGELNKASNHLLMAGGKRLRPAVTLLGAEAVKKGSSQDILAAALALEVTHTFTLVHDDIMDADSTRRGVPTVHVVWDEPTAILAGDVLFAESFELICNAIADDKAKVRAVTMLARTCAEICQGQYLDMAFEGRSDVDPAEYIEMVSKKTGVLYAAAAAIGGTLAGGNVQQVQALYDWGIHSGIAFQIQDDLIDIMALAENTGKDRASDLREGKQTLIAILAQEKGLDLTPYRKDDLTEAEIDEAISLLKQEGIIAEVQAIAADRVERAKKVLAILPDCEERRLLGEITNYFVTRGY